MEKLLSKTKKSSLHRPRTGKVSKPKKKTWKDIENKGNIANYNQDAIYGYIRLNYKDKTKIFPIEIIKLIIFFYQDGINWKFSKDEVELFNTAKNKYAKILSDPININDTIFQYVIYPKYCEPYSWSYQQQDIAGDVKFGLEIKTMPKNIEYMKIYFELRCVETNNYFKTTHTFGTHQASGSIINFIKNKDIQNKKYQTLTFQGCMDILCVKYRENHRLNHDPRFMDLTKMDRTCKFEWKIEKELIKSKLDKYKGNTNYIEEWRIYSPSNFNHNVFGLCFSNCQEVNGLNVRDRNYFLVAIRMFRIPANVKKLDIKYQCIINGKKYKRSSIIKSGSEQSFKCYKFSSCFVGGEYIKNINIKDINIKVQIEIVAVFDYNDKKIKEDQWRKYGIL